VKKIILRNGILAGLIVGIPMILYMTSIPAHGEMNLGMLVTYVLMLLALGMVFVGIRQYRDRVLGGVIAFVPALAVGLGISAVAGILYAIAWEITLPLMKFDFIKFYSDSIIEQARAQGSSVEAAAARAAEFTRTYANPLIRVPFTFLDIFPVGILVSLVSAALLRNSRFLPATRVQGR
jgi:hypothetical protein